MPRTITKHAVKDESLHELAGMASKQWTAQFNPRLPRVDDLVERDRAAL